jgi:hypothetical protein
MKSINEMNVLDLTWFQGPETVDYLWKLLSSTFSDSSEAEIKNVRTFQVDDSIDFEETEFHSFVRKHIVILLLFVIIYLISFYIIRYLKTKTDNDELYAGDEDFIVYRISIWMCSCSLATSIGAVTLLPFSILGSEVLQLYPDNYYLKWLNWSLINSMWTYIFTLSNLALFFLLPFAYFFLESQGFSFNQKSKTKSLRARFVESIIVCFLVLVLLVVFADVIYSLHQSTFSFSIFNLSIPFVYSLVSMLGGCVLLVSTPLGFSRMFDVCSNLLITPRSNNPMEPANFEEEVYKLELLDQQRKLRTINGSVYPRTTFDSNGCCLTRNFDGSGDADISLRVKSSFTPPKFSFIRRMLNRVLYVFELLKYPIIMLLLLLLTVLSVSMVLVNSLQLLFGYRALPAYVQYVELRSRHTFGFGGAIVETIIIIYIAISSLVGVYSIPFLSKHHPKKGSTSMTGIIGNCTLILLLSSALPVLARTLGITSFDLLGAYGRLDWISNFSLIMGYNCVFCCLTILSLVNKFTSPVRREILRRIRVITRRESISHTKTD